MPISDNNYIHMKHALLEQIMSRSMLLAMVTLAVNILINANFGAFPLAMLQSVAFIILPILYIALKRGAPHLFISHALGLMTLSMFVPLLFMYTPANSGIYWVFVFPLLVFYVLGLHVGRIWVGFYYAMILMGLLATYFSYMPLYYTPMQIGLALAELTFFTFISYFVIDDREQAEKKQWLHANHLECINHIEQSLHSHISYEDGINDALQSILDTFKCSRAWLIYPCNLDATAWSAPFKKELAAFPCPFNTGESYPINDGLKETFQHALQSSDTICYNSSKHVPGDEALIQTFSIQSQMNIALHPHDDEPWLLGIQQCDYARAWSDDEKQLFKDLSLRIGNALNQMLLYNNLKASAEKLTEASQKAEAANHAKSEFLSVMSHELRTPLHGIIGLQELIAEDKGNLNHEQLEHLHLAQQAATSLRDLVNDILSLSKFDANAIKLNEQSFSLKECLLDSLAPFVIICRNKKLALKLNMSDVPEIIKADKVRLRQVLINLIGNAVKFTKQGSIYIHIEEDSGMLSFHIHDTGDGISPEMIQDIFKPFVQEETLSNTKHQGTGLGTTIAKRFVELMGGHIDVDSELSIGSCFSFYIPCNTIGSSRINWQVDAAAQISQDKVEHQEENIETSTPTLTGKFHVLLAEDDLIGQRIAMKTLTRAGITVDIASDGYAAWNKVLDTQYDLLLTDVRMPKLDGIQLTQRIRQHEQANNLTPLPIIGLSAHVLEQVEQECMQAGMNAFMCKPINVDSILREVQKHINT